jgi:hypothetical protein
LTGAAFLARLLIRSSEALLPLLTGLVTARPAATILARWSGAVRTMVLTSLVRSGHACGWGAFCCDSRLISRRLLRAALVTAMRLPMRTLVPALEPARAPHFD